MLAHSSGWVTAESVGSPASGNMVEEKVPGRLDSWRSYFRDTQNDIFDVIEQAILVAAMDHPSELLFRRDRITQMLFSSQLLTTKQPEHGFGGGSGSDHLGSVCSGMVKDVTISTTTCQEGCNEGVTIMLEPAKCSNDEAEVLTEEINDGESEIVKEVLRIKKILLDNADESDALLSESLRKLQLMRLTVEILKSTQIGRAVRGLRKHQSMQIRCLVRTLVDGWKMLVDEWVIKEKIEKTDSFVISGPEKSVKKAEDKVSGGTKFHRQHDISGSQKPPTVTQDKFDYCDEMSVQAKLEASKKRLREGYHEDERKRRKLKVVELKDIPKQGLDHRHPFLKQGHHIKHLTVGRH